MVTGAHGINPMELGPKGPSKIHDGAETIAEKLQH
jgi:hypothetical protein